MATETTGLSVPLALAAAGAALGWVVVFVGIASTRRAPNVRAKDASSDLPAEPPAVAGLLANDFIVPSETAPAVVLDLAARRVIDLDEVQPGRTIARLRRRHDEALAPYEQRVLSELEDKAIDGVVPTEAMTTGPEAQSAQWQRSLQREVVADAQARGLTYNRWTPRVLGILGLTLVPAGILLYLAIETGDDRADGWLGWASGAVALAIIVLGIITIGRMSRSLAQLPTASGAIAAAYAAGLESHLRDDKELAELPPAAVKVRGRHFAFAAAFGLASVAVALLPMGAEDDHRAWSRAGGRWRLVRVRYPRAWPPAWGKHPAFAAFLAVGWGGLAVLAIVGITKVLDSDPDASFSADAWQWVERGALLLAVPCVVVAAWAAVVLVRAIPDLWSTRQISGEVLRDRRRRQWLSSGDDPKYWNYLAVDEGTSKRILAFRLRASVWQAHNQGDEVTAVVTPGLGYVRSIEKKP